MTTLSQFTSSDEIRAVLGVTPEELEDITLELPSYLRNLQFELEDIAPTLEASYLAIAALPSRSTAQQKLYDVMQAFAPYATARLLLTSLSLFAPKVITDGRASTERVVDPFSDVRDGVDAGYFSLKERLKSSLIALGTTVSSTSRVFAYSVSAGLSINPVTNT